MNRSRPLARPVASSWRTRFARSEGATGPNLQTTPTPNRSAKSRAGAYVTAQRVAALQHDLSPRDRGVLDTLARLRVATGLQLERACFADLSRRQARRSLASLVDRRLLTRLHRRIGGVRAGSGGYVYALDVAGQRLTRSRGGRPQRAWPVGMSFLMHTLSIAELYVRLVEAERAGHLRLVRFVTEPGSWRGFHGGGGARATLKPDAVVIVQLGRFEDSWFVEVDQGSEPRTTLTRKFDQYRAYWQAGVEQARSGVFPRVLWLVPDERRRGTLVEIVGRQPGEAWTLFAVACFDDAIATLLGGAGP